MASLPVIPGGHERFVHPASYLRRPRGQSQPMAPAKPESAVERDQRIGLVSRPWDWRLSSAPCALSDPTYQPTFT